jgi:hypothetical protein
MKWLAGFILALMVPVMSTSAGEADVVQVNITISEQYPAGIRMGP